MKIEIRTKAFDKDKKVSELTEEEVMLEFGYHMATLPEDNWWTWVREWFDIGVICEIIDTWDLEIQRDCLDRLRRFSDELTPLYEESFVTEIGENNFDLSYEQENLILDREE